MKLLPIVSLLAALGLASRLPAENPIISDVFTADPATLVHGDTV